MKIIRIIFILHFISDQWQENEKIFQEIKGQKICEPIRKAYPAKVTESLVGGIQDIKKLSI